MIFGNRSLFYLKDKKNFVFFNKLFKNKQKETQSKRSEMFMFWQYLTKNAKKNGKLSDQKTFFSYWFLPLIGFILLQSIQSSFLKKKDWSFFTFSKDFSIFQEILIQKSIHQKVLFFFQTKNL